MLTANSFPTMIQALLELTESSTFIAERIDTTLYGSMMRDGEELDLEAPLSSLGVDSLISVELRNWLRQKVGVEITVLEIANSGSLLALGEHTAAMLGQKFQVRP